jgi:hypothetical protein
MRLLPVVGFLPTGVMGLHKWCQLRDQKLLANPHTGDYDAFAAHSPQNRFQPDQLQTLTPG